MEFTDDGEILNICSSSKEEENLLTVSTGFYDYEYEDDEVFLDDSQCAEMESSEMTTTARVRRTSDVIDCVGGSMCPAQIKRHSFPSTSSESVYSATSKATSIKELNKSRHSELTTESLDLGYSSPGAQSLGRSWFRYSTSNDADSIDAKPTNATVQQQTSSPSCTTNKLSFGYKKPIDVTNMPVAKDATNYNMDHEFRGVAVIINNDIFEGPAAQSLPERSGSWKDVEELKIMFYRLYFRVVIWNNLTHEDIEYRINKLSSDDHSDNDCLCMVVLTHGINSSFIYAKDNPYPVESLWNWFTADRCPTLAGKPKIFFVQACRGEKLDSGVTLRREIKTEVDSSTAAYKIPKHADFLIAFSTYDGYYSFRHPENGTWFIQSLCTELNKHELGSIDLLAIMTRVSRRVALDHESYNPEYPWLHRQKQIPTIHSMLIRDVFFKPKKKPPPEPEVVV